MSSEKVENRICQNCQQNFVIESDDFAFYEKIKVPAPTWCPGCRLIRRLAYRGERALYKDNCDKCGKNIVTIHAPDTPFTVYCSSCWWGDDWDATEYGKEYDFSRPFFEQLHELQKVVPCQATNLRNSTDCNYCHGLVRCKNCMLVFQGFQSIHCFYCQTPILSRDSLDSDVIVNADHAYETINSNSVFNTKFNYFSDNCFDCSFLFDCRGCSNCFGCVNLRNQKYTIFNKRYTKDDYQKELSRWDLGSYQILQEAQKKFMEIYYKNPRQSSLITNSVNVLGDDIKNTKNCQICFATRNGVENCKYIFFCGLLLKDSYDVTLGGDTSELLYEVTGSTQAQRTIFTRASNHVIGVEYSENIYDGFSLFGCAKLRHKRYCILNKQYTEEEYEALIPKIKKHMNDMPYVDKMGRVYKYGEFYPPEHSMWAYNETQAHHWFPLTKNKALTKGYSWRDETARDYKITLDIKSLPDHIKDVPDSILEEVIECAHHESACNEQCTTAFRILPDELRFYRSMKLALPRLCPNCRYYQRLKKRNPPKLWHRKCMCDGVKSKNNKYQNTTEHFHSENACQNEFFTAISNGREEIVYCKQCYQSEFL